MDHLFGEVSPSFSEMWTKHVGVFTTDCLRKIYSAIGKELKSRKAKPTLRTGVVMMTPRPADPDNHYQLVGERIYDSDEEALHDFRNTKNHNRKPVTITWEE